MARNRKSRLTRLETLAQIALHAFPARYCHAYLQDPASSAAYISESSRAELLKNLAALPLLQRAFIVVAWPPAMVLLALALTATNGLRTRQRFHRGVAAQFSGQLRLAFGHGIPPTLFYLYELHEPQNRERAHEYILRAQLKRGGNMYKRLYRDCPQRGQRAGILNDKIAFAQFCRARNLPAPRIFAFVAKGVFTWMDTNSPALPAATLFIKPSNDNGGEGTERWVTAGGLYREKDDRVLKADALLRHLAEKSQRTPLLVQECLVNHPELADLTAGALSTLRMYTFLNEGGEAEHIFSMLRMSRDPRRIVDNVCRGGLAAQVDPASGTLGPATDGGMLARTGWLDHHPFTGARIAGRRIPYWREALDLAISAHREVAALFMVGWDIAITRRGPVIVEGNKAPDIDIEQRLSGPWGNQRFGALLAHHIRSPALNPPSAG